MDAFLEGNTEGLTTAREFAGSVFVLRLDESTAHAPTLVEDLLFMRRVGVRPVIVVDAEQRRLSERLIGLINRVGGEAVGLDGTSASTLVVSSSADGRAVVRRVNTSLLGLLLEQGYIPVFTARGTSIAGTPTPLDAADAARELAAAVRAKRLLYPSGTGGIRLEDDEVVAELTASEALALAATGRLDPDQAKQLAAAALGVRSGVDAAQLLDLTATHAALVELLTSHHLGTQVISHVLLTN